ncbi:MAG TPA: Rid family detoxifying hydrolase [Candidatus Binatia bacterium]|nr:Rid family detoxifying hydrolase [Candidatus Binatia bacterium]
MSERIATERAPRALGPYAQAVVAGDLVFCAGQVGIDPATGTLVAGGIAAETARACENLAAVLAAAGLGLRDVVRTTVYVVDLAEFATLNEVYGRWFGAPHPARATVQVAALPAGARVEIDAIAARPAGTGGAGRAAKRGVSRRR